MIRRALALLGAAVLLAPLVPAQNAPPDVILKAMVDELQRSRQLRVVDLDQPYYIEYSVEDAHTFSAAATLGGLIRSLTQHALVPQIEVRVGSYDFDDTDHLYSTYFAGERYDPVEWPVDKNYDVLRHDLWLATDRAYRTAIQAIARKRGTLRNVADASKLPDFAKEPPVTDILNSTIQPVNDQAWTKRVVSLSDIFSAYPQIMTSGVEAQVYQGTSYFVNSEGTEERTPDMLSQLRAEASTQASDGMLLHDAVIFQSLDINGLPSDLDLRRGVTAIAEEVKALAQAPVGDSYAGPVLFEGQAAAQLFAQLLGDNLRVPRRPLADPGRQVPFIPSEYEGKVGLQVLPAWMDVVDDPTQTEWRGHPLVGHYLFDMEGMPPKPVVLIENGVLKNYLMTRQPIQGFSGSNGHARLPGHYGAREAAIGNLFIKATNTESEADLKKQLIEMCKQRNKPYGILVRKLDFPTTASISELRADAAASMQSGGGPIPVSRPILAYRVYPDGHEELVRGLRFRGVSTRSLRDIVAASDQSYLFEFINNGAPLAMVGAPGFLAPSSVVSPSILFQELEFERPQEELSRPPLVPPPPLEPTPGS
jgi:TldD protein